MNPRNSWEVLRLQRIRVRNTVRRLETQQQAHPTREGGKALSAAREDLAERNENVKDRWLATAHRRKRSMSTSELKRYRNGGQELEFCDFMIQHITDSFLPEAKTKERRAELLSSLDSYKTKKNELEQRLQELDNGNSK